MAEKSDSIPLTAIESGKASSNSKPNGDSEAYGVAVTVDGDADEKLITGNDESKAIEAAMHKRLATNDFTGLTKEELAKFAVDPYWRKVRVIMFALFWAIWLALLIAAVVIIIVTPKCPPRPDVPFYQKDAVYKVLPLTFAVQKDGKGNGHVIGLEQKLSYIKSLGTTTVALGPVFTANSLANALYDSTDNKEMDQSIGHFSPCLQRVTKEAAKQGMKVLVEAQINFASVKHSLFSAQILSANPKSGPFVVRSSSDVTGELLARDGKSAWRDVASVYPNVTGLVYYSSFTADVVEWDFNTPAAVDYALETVKKLVQQEIDGVIIKDASFLTECNGFEAAKETQPADDAGDFGNTYWKFDHPCTVNQNGSLEVLRRISQVIAARNAEDDRRKRVLLVELAAASNAVSWSAFTGIANGAFIDTVTNVGYASRSCDVQCVRRRIEKVAGRCTQKPLEPIRYPMWQFSTPEYGRFTTRFGVSSATAFFTLGAFLPGGFGTYYGDEVAVADVGVTAAETDSLFFDARFRSTMQWTADEPFAGFLAPAKPSSALADGLVAPTDPRTYLTANALVQQAAGYADSRSQLLQQLLKARNSAESAQWGTFYSLTDALVSNVPALRSTLIAFARVAIGFDPVVVIINGLGDATADQVGSLSLDQTVCNTLRSNAEWSAAFASNADVFKCDTATVLFAAGSKLSAGYTLKLSNVFFGANQVLVLRIPKTSA